MAVLSVTTTAVSARAKEDNGEHTESHNKVLINLMHIFSPSHSPCLLKLGIVSPLLQYLCLDVPSILRLSVLSASSLWSYTRYEAVVGAARGYRDSDFGGTYGALFYSVVLNSSWFLAMAIKAAKRR